MVPGCDRQTDRIKLNLQLFEKLGYVNDKLDKKQQL